MNEAELRYCRVDQWHAAGYTGSGIKIGIHEISGVTIPNLERFAGRVLDPFGIRFDDGALNTHAQRIIDVIRIVAPDAEIYMLGTSLNENIRYARDNGLDLYNYSTDGGADNPETNALEQEALAAGVFFVCAAGNDGDDGLSTMSRKGSWCSVGAARIVAGVPVRMAYSSYDHRGDDLDSMGFAEGLRVPDEINGGYMGVSGTSFAAPWVLALLALFKQKFYEDNGRKPTDAETWTFIRENCTDMDMPGYDVYTGNGILRLPELTEGETDLFQTITAQNGNTAATIDGQPYILKAAPIYMNGRLYLGIRDIAELTGGEVISWSDESLTAVVKLPQPSDVG